MLPLYTDSAGTLTPSGIGLLFTYAAILSVIFQLPLVQASARMNGFAVVLTSGASLGLRFGILPWSASLPGAAAAVSLLALAACPGW